jgi:hypothetical protein
MTRRPFEKIKDIDDTKSLWRIAVRVKDLWVVRHGKTNNQHFEMVVCDELVTVIYLVFFFNYVCHINIHLLYTPLCITMQGDEIQVTVPSDLNEIFKTQFSLHQTCTLQSFSVGTQ